MDNQPTPPFTIEELASKLDQAYRISIAASKDLAIYTPALPAVKELAIVNGILQELIAIVDQKRRDLDSINPSMPTSQVMTDVLATEKPAFHVTGVQLIENNKLVGTSLYSTVIKARKIKDILNTKFAELRVDHVAKLVNYPVF